MIQVSKNKEADEKRGSMLECDAAAKWALVIDDVVVPMPRRVVPVDLVKELASVPEDFVLVRDHNSPNDVVLDDAAEIDLALGNVFYRLKRCDVQSRDECRDVAKRAWILNDVAEITVRPTLTGKSLRELFNLPAHSTVLRDTEGPNDVAITPDDEIRFEGGPVFVSHEVQAKLKIIVNHTLFTEHDGVKKRMSGLEIAALAYPDNPSETRVIFLSEANREVPLDEIITIENCEEFEVVRRGVSGGFERRRVERELSEFATGGQRVTLLDEPVNCVVYHDLPTKPDAGLGITDVLVPIPGGYPGQMIDWAYLPENSPLINKAKGQPQDHRITALGRVWRQISYHPHHGGGGPSWNPTVHGFHTYRGELVAWLYDLQ